LRAPAAPARALSVRARARGRPAVRRRARQPALRPRVPRAALRPRARALRHRRGVRAPLRRTLRPAAAGELPRPRRDPALFARTPPAHELALRAPESAAVRAH